ncbi:Major Facilitator Superfamily protein [Candida albicans]|uniref:Major Facilitator Superfamily protein n=1 Tax=Candida albicans TaxID=5476 RepID=A0A8H6BVJ3_CANAX|nr:Major Facilitator Superfamily protein [Candida albicans]
MFDKEINEIPEYEMVPGTVQLVDVTGTLEVEKNGDKSNIILQPPPSKNINDPLRWSKRKRRIQFFLLFIWSFLQSSTSNFTGPLYDAFVEALDVTYQDISNTAALCFTGLGLGVIIIQPCAAKYGKRVVYLTCTLIAIIGCIVGGTGKNLASLYIFNFLSGLGASPVDSIAEVSANDLHFQHERSTALSVIIMALYFGSFLSPVAAGYITANPHLGWRWCFYVQIIIYAVLFIFMFFVLEDTTFTRDSKKEDEFEEHILQQVQSMRSKDNVDVILSSSASVKTEENESVDESTIPKKTYWERMKLIHTEYGDRRSWLLIFVRPAFLAYFPAIIWSSCAYGAQMMWLSLMGNTQTLFYASEPYNFTADKVGLTNLAPFVVLFWHKLWTMIVPLLFNAAGLIAYGLGPYYGAHWAISVIIGQGFLGFAMAASGTLCLTYGAFDCYHKLAGESVVLILFIRNMFGMIFCFACQPWIDNSGVFWTTITMCILSIVINGGFAILLVWGKTFRKWTAEPYERYSDSNYGNIF